MEIIDWIKNKVYNVDNRIALDQLPDNSIDCFISSPPYYCVRDYGLDPQIWDGDKNCDHEWGELQQDHKYSGGISKGEFAVGQFDSDKTHFQSSSCFCNKCGAWKGSLGLEPTVDLFIKHLCDIYDKVMRVLKPTGTVWVNIADTYSSGGKTQTTGRHDTQKSEGFGGWGEWDGGLKSVENMNELPGKCLYLVPERFAIEMVRRGWILRNRAIFYKPNAMPQSVKDRMPIDYEDIFFFVKSKKYFYDREATREEIAQTEVNLNRRKYQPGKNEGRYSDAEEFSMSTVKDQYWSEGKYKRTVWTINTKASPVRHYATFPEKLVEPMILAGCPERVCKKCGKPLAKIYEEIPNPDRVDRDDKPNVQGSCRCPGDNYSNLKVFEGYETCDCDAGWKPGTVVDIFGGIGTTALTAISLNRDWILFDLSKDYCGHAKQLTHERIYSHNAEEAKNQGDFMMI